MPAALKIFKRTPDAATELAESGTEGSGAALPIICFSAINIALGVGGFAFMILLTQGASFL